MSKSIHASKSTSKPTQKKSASRSSKAPVPRGTSVDVGVPSASSSMVRAKTLRLTPEFEAGLGLLKGILGKPVNKMVNEAVGEYIRKRSAEVETNLSGVLEKLKAYRRADPGFKQDLAQFVKAEALYGGDDPVEGVVVDVEPPRARARKSKVGPAQTMDTQRPAPQP